MGKNYKIVYSETFKAKVLETLPDHEILKEMLKVNAYTVGSILETYRHLFLTPQKLLKFLDDDINGLKDYANHCLKIESLYQEWLNCK